MNGLSAGIALMFLLLVGCGEDSEGKNAGAAGTSGSSGSGGRGASSAGGTSGTGGSGNADGGGTGGGSGQAGAGATGNCYAPTEKPPSVAPNGFFMPSLEDEKSTYRSWGFSWAPDAEPNVPAEPGYTVSDPDIHGDTEGDDLWSYVMMHERTKQPGYLDRAKAWARYFKDDYRNCVGGSGTNFCYDRDAFGADHLWGWGLIAWHLVQADAAALAEAERIAELLEGLYGPSSSFGCLPKGACTYYGLRQPGRHLLFMTRIAEVTGSARWAKVRDQIIDLLLKSPEWDAQRGMYFEGDFGTDAALGSGAFAAGARIQSSFMIGVFTEGLDHAYRMTGRQEIRDRLIAMARFVEKYGLDPTYDYTASTFGIVDGKVWHSYSAQTPVSFWDPVYTTSLVNTLMRGYLYSCEPHFYESAKHFFVRGNGGIYGEPTRRAAPDKVIHHFVDTRFASASGNFYLDYNKGELQYTYLLFQPVKP